MTRNRILPWTALSLSLASTFGCDAIADTAPNLASAADRQVASSATSWLILSRSSDGSLATRRVDRAKGPPSSLRPDPDSHYTLIGEAGRVLQSGQALVGNELRANFSNIDGPARGHHLVHPHPTLWVPLPSFAKDDTEDVTLTLSGTRGHSLVPEPIVVPPKDVVAHSSHAFEEMDVSGPPESRINIVIVGDGYTELEGEKFRQDSEAVADFLFSTRPYGEYKSLFNTYRLVTQSPESGASHPDNGIDVLNVFNSRFNCGGIARLLCADDNRVLNAVYEHLWDVDQVLLLVNDPRYGGGGGNIATTSTHELSPAIAVHEFGHSLAGLADEYEDAAGDQSRIAPEANVSLNSNFDELKWNHWVEEGTPLPTYAELAASDLEPIGAYEGARYFSTDIYRPAPACMMRVSESALCAVCTEESVIRFHAQSSTITSAIPSPNIPLDLANQPSPLDFRIEVADLPNLSIEWFVDGEPATGAEDLTFDPSSFPAAQQLKVVVSHSSELVRSDPQGHLSEQIVWNLSDGISEEDEQGAGCGCQQAPGSSKVLALLFLFALVLLRRTRQTHSLP